MDPKVVNILKEGRHAFHVLVGKVPTPGKAHSHSLTAVPIALAIHQKYIYNKVLKQRLGIDEPTSIIEVPPNRGNWLNDVITVVRSIRFRKTGRICKHRIECLLAAKQIKAIADRNHIRFLQYIHNKAATPRGF